MMVQLGIDAQISLGGCFAKTHGAGFRVPERAVNVKVPADCRRPDTARDQTAQRAEEQGGREPSASWAAVLTADARFDLAL